MAAAGQGAGSAGTRSIPSCGATGHLACGAPAEQRELYDPAALQHREPASIPRVPHAPPAFPHVHPPRTRRAGARRHWRQGRGSRSPFAPAGPGSAAGARYPRGGPPRVGPSVPCSVPPFPASPSRECSCRAGLGQGPAAVFCAAHPWDPWRPAPRLRSARRSQDPGSGPSLDVPKSGDGMWCPPRPRVRAVAPPPWSQRAPAGRHTPGPPLPLRGTRAGCPARGQSPCSAARAQTKSRSGKQDAGWQDAV